MKTVLKIAAVLAAIAGLIYAVSTIIKKQADKSTRVQVDNKMDDEYVSLSEEKDNPVDEVKQNIHENIAARHKEAAVEMKDSAEAILETSVSKDQTNEARLEQIKDTLKDI